MSEHEIEIRDELTDFLLYTTPSHGVRVEIFLHETVWLTQKRLAELFSVKIATINEHLKNIYASGELTELATIRKSLIVQKEGGREVRREVKFYNLDAILSVGYRVNSSKASRLLFPTLGTFSSNLWKNLRPSARSADAFFQPLETVSQAAFVFFALFCGYKDPRPLAFIRG